MLTKAQIDLFWDTGVIMVEDAVTSNQLDGLKAVFSNWVKESQNHSEDYGEVLDGRPRFDLAPGHSKKNPGLRRVQSPEEISTAYADVMRNSKIVDFASDLVGPAIRFHHGKINSKLPGTVTEVKFHQDFSFQPMTNDDMITALLFMDDVTLDNGPLEVVPGTHKGPLYTHWHDGIFTGAVADEVAAENKEKIIKCTGQKGTVCLMHANLLHGSAPNLSSDPRTLYIVTYYAEDAIELSPNHLPSKLTHEVIRGKASGKVRCSSYDMLIPEVPKGTSFFSQQAGTAEN